MGRLITKDVSGNVLVDSDYVSLGLVKSGYLVKSGKWQRWRRTAINNPAPAPYNMYDELWSFSVNAISPIVYISGRCLFVGSEKSGNIITYFYAHASTSVKYFVFDQMRELGGGVKMKLFNSQGKVTFDSSQIPLNIYTSVTPPSPTAYDNQYKGYGVAYAGGTTTSTSTGNFSTCFSTWSINIGSGDLAVNLPWSRGCAHTESDSNFGAFSGREGAYGSGSSVVFIMATEAGGYFNSFFRWAGADGWFSKVFFGIPVDRIPTASVINIQNLPFPYNIT